MAIALQSSWIMYNLSSALVVLTLFWSQDLDAVEALIQGLALFQGGVLMVNLAFKNHLSVSSRMRLKY